MAAAVAAAAAGYPGQAHTESALREEMAFCFKRSFTSAEVNRRSYVQPCCCGHYSSFW